MPKINEGFRDTIERLNSIFAFINSELFRNELPEVLITVEPDKKKGKVAGWYQGKTYWNFGGETIAQINICAEYLSHPWMDISECLIHESVHLFCHMNHHVTKNNYHNLAFKEAAEGHGLTVEKTKNGWARTDLKPETKKSLEAFMAKNDFGEKPLIFREMPPPKPVDTEYTPKHIRFKCPMCEISINTPYPKPFSENFECPRCRVAFVEVPIKRRNTK